MADLLTLAKPYAKAAFEFAQQHDALDDWGGALEALGAIAQNADFAELLQNPALTDNQKATVLLDVYGTKSPRSPMQAALSELGEQLPASMAAQLGHELSSHLSPSIVNFVQQLADHQRLALLPSIARAFEKMRADGLGQLDVQVVSAYPLSSDERAALQKKLVDKFDCVIVLHESVDQNLMGGLTLKAGDKFIDGSVRGKLQQLKSALLS